MAWRSRSQNFNPTSAMCHLCRAKNSKIENKISTFALWEILPDITGTYQILITQKARFLSSGASHFIDFG